MELKRIMEVGILAASLCCSTLKAQERAFDKYPIPDGEWTECVYAVQSSSFALWAPSADKVRLTIYGDGQNDVVEQSVDMEKVEGGMWRVKIEKDLKGKFYTFNVYEKGKWLGETPGVKAMAVGVNGRRGAIIDMQGTNPKGWESDERPNLHSWSDIIIYEMHHRDFSISLTSGVQNRGKYIALTEEGTRSPEGLMTGIDHLKELGVTHVHLLPSFDFASVDENHLERAQYNWGYDPLNYNVPEGSYSTDPFDPSVRIREFKEMVQSLHKAGIRVVLDVVYNHTFDIKGSNFQLTVPDYFYRKRADGSYANGSGCLNETASERAMMRRYIVESVLYWAKEYHLDGFRFDLMGNHDIETMKAVREAVNAYDKTIFVYGEGWAAEQPQMSLDSLAMKANIYRMPGIAAFGDEARDAIRGPFNDDSKSAFLNALSGNEESIKFGIVGAVRHPQVDNKEVNYSKEPWADQPTQSIIYVSCHDDMCLTDRLKASMPKSSEEERLSLDKLAQTIVLTSQGVPFLFCGEEVNRSKQGVHNSFNSPDSINAIDWSLKSQYKDLFEYYKGLIALRKAHPAFRMGDAELIRKNLVFLPVKTDHVIAYSLSGKAVGDTAEEVVVVFNANKKAVRLSVAPGVYKVLCKDGKVSVDGLGVMKGGKICVSGQSALILCR